MPLPASKKTSRRWKRVAQARRTSERLAPVKLAAIYASPIERTMQTAAIIAEPHAMDVRICEGVVEKI